MMKLLYISFLLPLFLGGCGGGSAADQSSPKALMETVFRAATQDNPKLLGTLCPPSKGNDGDTDCLCALSSDYTPHKCAEDSHNRVPWSEFVNYFKDGSISGEALVKGEKAEVNFLFGPGGKKKETMRMVKEDGKWYLYSF